MNLKSNHVKTTLSKTAIKKEDSRRDEKRARVEIDLSKSDSEKDTPFVSYARSLSVAMYAHLFIYTLPRYRPHRHGYSNTKAMVTKKT